MEATDYTGRPLAVGDLVEAWQDVLAYQARVTAIAPHQPGDGDYCRITVQRALDGALVETFSDAVTVIS